MTSPITQAIGQANQDGRAAFIPYVTGGYPDYEVCAQMIQALDQSGADIIEVGIPFSDPLADGPTIQLSSTQALENGTTPPGVLEMIARVAPSVKAPLVVMTYINPVMRMGFAEFAKAAKGAGVAGVIIPDLPPEQAEDWVAAAREAEVDTIFLAAPTTTPERLERLFELGRGFLYYVSMTGVTGTDLVLDDELQNAIAGVRKASPLPVAVGFGVSKPAQANNLAAVADGVIVGSALVKKLIDAGGDHQGGIAAAGELARSLSQALTR